MKDYTLNDIRKINEAYETMLNEADVANQFPTYSDEQITNIMRRNAWGEGRQGGISGMKDVIDVVKNRSNGDNSNLVGVISAPKQFSAWNGMKPSDWNPDSFKLNNHEDAKGVDKKRWEETKNLVNNALQPDYKPGHNYTYYVTKEQYDKDWNKNPKRWYYMKKPDEVRGQHYFFKTETIEGKGKTSFNSDYRRYRNKDVASVPNQKGITA